MTAIQRVIKYLAIAFAIFLIVGIFGSLIALGSGITDFFIQDKNIENEVHVYSEEELTLKTLNINIAASDLKIKNGEKFKIETNNKDVIVKKDGDKVTIEEKNKKLSFRKRAYEITIYIPEDFKFDEVNIETGAGKLNIKSLESKNLKLKLGAGKTVIDSVISDNTDIETGAGELVIKNGILNDSKIEVGIGKLSAEAEFIGNTKIETGIGSCNIKLIPTEDNYKIEFKKGLGDIRYNGESIANDSIVGEGLNFIKIEGGIGSIKVEEKH